jgi:hypothetical protein
VVDQDCHDGSSRDRGVPRECFDPADVELFHTAANREEILRSRVLSTRVAGRAIARAARQPRVWLQASTATIYAHRYDSPNDEHSGMDGFRFTYPDWRGAARDLCRQSTVARERAGAAGDAGAPPNHASDGCGRVTVAVSRRCRSRASAARPGPDGYQIVWTG